jgi:uncharacterized metal-binding protein YceD (DUF177 family)
MESVRDNLVFSLEAWPETGYECDFALSPGLLTEILASQSGEPPKLLTSMRGHLKLQVIGKQLKVSGFFAVKAELICDRCLSPFDARIDDKFDDLILLAGPGVESDQAELAIVPNGQDFDLTSLMAEFFWLAWPYKALCRPDCAGLCPHCGANLNEGPCYCQDQRPTKH